MNELKLYNKNKIMFRLFVLLLLSPIILLLDLEDNANEVWFVRIIMLITTGILIILLSRLFNGNADLLTKIIWGEPEPKNDTIKKIELLDQFDQNKIELDFSLIQIFQFNHSSISYNQSRINIEILKRIINESERFSIIIEFYNDFFGRRHPIWRKYFPYRKKGINNSQQKAIQEELEKLLIPIIKNKGILNDPVTEYYEDQKTNIRWGGRGGDFLIKELHEEE